MAYGKKIEIFLTNGDPDGLVTCSLPQWTGRAYRFAKDDIKLLKNRDKLKKGDKEVAAVYMLFGAGENEEPLAYIGETDELLKRLQCHYNDKEKEFWTNTIVFFSTNENSLNKSLVKYLESRLISIALETGRYKLKLGKASNEGNISEADKADMGVFIENIRLLTNILGHKIFEPFLKKSIPSDESQPTSTPSSDKVDFFIKQQGKIVASGVPSREGFVVLKGSSAMKETSNTSFKKKDQEKRDDLIQSGVISDNGERFIFNKDWLFNTPSAAAKMILERSTNGLTEWQNEHGTSLQDYRKGL